MHRGCRFRQHGHTGTGGTHLIAIQSAKATGVVDQNHCTRSQHRHYLPGLANGDSLTQVLHHHFLVAQHHPRAVYRRSASEDHHRAGLACRLVAAGGRLQQRSPTRRALSPDRRQITGAVSLFQVLCRGARTIPPDWRAPTANSPAQHHHLRHSSGWWQHHPKAVPCPVWVDVSMRPPKALISERTTSMPMPRPDKPVTSVAVLKPGMKIRLAATSSLSSSSACSRPCATAFSRIRARFRTCSPVVAELHRHVVAFVPQIHRDGSGGWFASGDPHVRFFDAVGNAVTQQVLEGRCHAVQHPGPFQWSLR